MWPAIIAAIFGIAGIALGGGVRAWEADRSRKKEADGLLSALVAEIDAITRLARHRCFAEGLTHMRQVAQAMVEAGQSDQPAPWSIIHLTKDYFVTYHSSLAKIGLLHPYYADRITRFYTFAKSSLEDYDSSSPHQIGISAAAAVAVLDNDLMILNTMLMLGDHIAGFRKVTPPAGMINPFEQPAVDPAPPFMSIDSPPNAKGAEPSPISA